MPAAQSQFARLLSRDGWLVLLAVGLVILWPGDVSWLMDEPRIIANAWHANHEHRLADGGLYGNFGIRYGPFPTQIYQSLLLLTHDPVTLVIMRSAFCTAFTGFALLWLGRSLELPGWFAAAALVSPHVVTFQRVLWDASFTVPLSTLALAGLAAFLRSGRAVPLRVCLTAGTLLPLIHPQALAIAVPVLGWVGWKHRNVLWRDRRALGLIVAIGLVSHGPYLVEVIGQVALRLFTSVEKGYPGGASHLQTALAPLLGGSLLCGADYLESLARDAQPEWLMSVLQWMARLIYPLCWLGIAVCGWRVWQRWPSLKAAKQQQHVSAAEFASVDQAKDVIALVLLGGVAVQAVLGGVLRIPVAPQYFFGTYALHVLLAWVAVDFLNRWKIGTPLGMLYGVAGPALTLSAAVVIHQHGFERAGWPTLGNSVEIARELNHYDDTTALTDSLVLQRSPQLLRTLRLLLPPTAEERAKPATSGRLLITSRDPDGQVSGRLRLVEMDEKSTPAVAAVPIDITPLPKGWVPDPATWQSK